MRQRKALLALLLAIAAFTSGCMNRSADPARDDIATILQLSHAEDRFNLAMREFAQRQIERNPELRPYYGSIDTFWREQVRWQDVREQLVADYGKLYTPEELRAIRTTLESPLGDRIVSHADVLNRELAGKALAAVQEKLPALDQHLRAVRSAREIGEAGELTPEQDFAAVQAKAQGGDAEAQMLLAEKYLAGAGTERSLGSALAWLEKSAAQDHAPAQDLLASFYYRGVGLARNYATARALMERAVARNYLPAVNNLAWLLATCPEDAQRDGKRAVALIEPRIDQSAQMLDTLAAAYAEAGDLPHAIELQKRAIAALGSTGDEKFSGFLERLQSYAAGKAWRDPAESAR